MIVITADDVIHRRWGFLKIYVCSFIHLTQKWLNGTCSVCLDVIKCTVLLCTLNHFNDAK